MIPPLTAQEEDEALAILDRLCDEIQAQYPDLANVGNEQMAADLLVARTNQLPGDQYILLQRLIWTKNFTIRFYSVAKVDT